jgi:hypothetical protein
LKDSLSDLPKKYLGLSVTAVGILTPLALTTAFVYNYFFYSSLDPRLLGLFVTSDHIETAVFCLPPIVFSIAIITWWFDAAGWIADPVKAKGLRALITVIGLAVIIVILDNFVFGRAKTIILVTVLESVVAAAVLEKWCGHIFSSERLVAKMMALAIVWLVMTISTAVIGAYIVKQEIVMRPDSIKLTQTSDLHGSKLRCPDMRDLELCSKVIRILDKGVILAASKAQFWFVPKEQFSGIELTVEPPWAWLGWVIRLRDWQFKYGP